MIHRTARGLTIALGVAATLLATPAESQALFCHLFGGNGCGWFGQRTTYRPLFGGAACCPAPACNPCTQQVCNYVPQTCYRAECVNVPVTTYRQVTSCDPCTGCPVTTCRPVTSYVRQVRYRPYTTYRQVCSQVAVAAPVTTSYAPASSAACCTPTSTPLVPSTSYPGPAATTPGTAIPATPVPTLPSSPATGYQGSAYPGTTVQPGTANYPAHSSPSNSYPSNGSQLRPIAPPDAQNSGSNSSQNSGGASTNSSGSLQSIPRSFDPASRTTRFPARSIWKYRSAVLSKQAEPTAEQPVVTASHSEPTIELDDGGWRAARQ